jgi:membrane associated rhomboid family serine protease
MTTTTVGMRCPECAGEKTKVHRMGSWAVEPRVTYALIAINVVLWLAEFSGGGLESRAYLEGVLFGPFVDAEPYRLLTGGFLHSPTSPFHILFNMYILYWLGGMLEPDLGHVRFAGLYIASLLTGSLGALLLSHDSPTVGASGAVFGLMAAAFVLQRAQGVDPMQSGIGPVILLNLGISFILPGISIGGHLGGLVGGALVALGYNALGRRRTPWAALGVAVAVGAVAAVASIAVATPLGL